MGRSLPTGTKGKYRKHEFVATSHTKTDDTGFFEQLMEFSDTYGWEPDATDHKEWPGLNQAKTYWWVHDPKDNTSVFLGTQVGGYNCVVCNNFNKYAEANLTEDRHICFSCRASYAWKYEDELLARKGL
jgi:hypothetical protein